MNDEPIAERTRWVENRRPPTTQNDVVIDVGRADQEPARSEVNRCSHRGLARGCRTSASRDSQVLRPGVPRFDTILSTAGMEFDLKAVGSRPPHLPPVPLRHIPEVGLRLREGARDNGARRRARLSYLAPRDLNFSSLPPFPIPCIDCVRRPFGFNKIR